MTIKVLEAVGSTTVIFEDDDLELLNDAREAYGFKDINSTMGYLVNAAKSADGSILGYENAEGTGTLLPREDIVEKLTPENEQIYVDLIDKVDFETICANKTIEELKGLSKSQRASVRIRLGNLLSKTMSQRGSLRDRFENLLRNNFRVDNS